MPNAASTGLPNPASYDVTVDGVVLDKVTGLMWQRKVDEGSDGALAQTPCANLKLGGFNDWRLPTRVELGSILDDTHSNPMIDPAAFPGMPGGAFQTATLAVDHGTTRWFVDFDQGIIDYGPVKHTRCVRTARPGTRARCYSADNDTVVDEGTGLTWQRAVDSKQRTWEEAASYCKALPLAGGGFRLPTSRELHTILDSTRANPSIDPVAFPRTPGDPFWTSSSAIGRERLAFIVVFDYGMVAPNAVDPDVENYGPEAKPATAWVRCVRQRSVRDSSTTDGGDASRGDRTTPQRPTR